MKAQHLFYSLLAASAAFASTAFAVDGVVGHDLVSFDAGYVWSNEDELEGDGYMLELEGRKNLYRAECFGVDLTGGVQYASLSPDGIDVDASLWALNGGVSLFYDTKGAVTPYMNASFGYARGSAQGYSADSYMYSVGVGSEVYVCPGISLSPEVSFARAPDVSSKTMVEVGLRADVWLSDVYCVYVGGGLMDVDGYKGYQSCIGVRGSF